MGNRWVNSGNSVRLYFGGLQNHCRWWLQPWNEKTLTPWKKSYDNLDSTLKSRDITLPTKVCLVKAMIFPVVMYGCEIWTIKKAEHWRIDDFEVWCWRRLLRVPWTARRSNQSIWKSYIFIGRTDAEAETPILLPPDVKNWLIGKDPDAGKDWGQEKKGNGRGWNGWMASLTQWTWIWANSGWQWRTGKPGVLQSVGLHRVGCGLALNSNIETLRIKL